MAKTNYQRVGEALEQLSRGLGPFVDRECRAAIGDDWAAKFSEGQAVAKGRPARKESATDVHFLLRVMWDGWNQIFGKTLGRSERTLVSELMDVRNRWAHQETFTTDDTYRALDSSHRLLQAVSAGDEAARVEASKFELLRIRYDEQARKEKKKVGASEGHIVAGLKPWREVVTPHPDVASGRYQQAEFAADLSQVHRGEGTDEYRDPSEFFRRTYLTDGLKDLLVEAVRRISGSGGAPVVELQTNFGGGKTHSLLGLYHLFAGVKASELWGVDAVLAEAGLSEIPKASRAVLVGTALSPGQPHHKSDGTEIRTLWGELAWQLGGADGYALVAKADATGTNPGDALGELFKRYSPCLVLIDEWVAYARQLYGKDELPAGTFDAHFTFAQALTEKARATKGVLVVISIPASESVSPWGEALTTEIEIGGEGGRAALERLKNVIGRMESPWRPASTEESFEIVRRRLFQEMTDPKSRAEKDAVAKVFSGFYRSQTQDFPSESKEVAYEKRIKNAYPIHPELFDRLYEDWSSLERFQRTRGVLRLMAAVIHALWVRQDMSPMIMPGTVPIDDPGVFPEITRYLEDNWRPVIEKDVDGPNSLPLEVDRDNPNLGRYSACRRVARTIYVGSAPGAKGAHRGIEDRRIRLGCVFPGESSAIFGDALRRLTDRATFLYFDGQRYWYSTSASIASLARERAEQRGEDEVDEEIRSRLAQDVRRRGDFAAAHAAPGSFTDIPDTPEARLVVLGPDAPHSSKTEQSAALKTAAEILEHRGGGPRRYRNMLVFLAPDSDRLAELEQSVKQYLAWSSIVVDAEELNLDNYSENQATSKRDQADDVVDQRLRETFQWLIVPSQPDPQQDMSWEKVRVQGQEPLAERASAKLKGQEGLITQLGGVRLKHELDRIPGLWRGDHVRLAQLWDDFAQYLYMPRLRNSSVLKDAVEQGISMLTWRQDSFGYAESWDKEVGRFRGLRAGQQAQVILDQQSVLVQPEVAAHQLEEDARTPGGPSPEPVPVPGPEPGKGEEDTYRRFYGTVSLDPERLGRDVAQIAEAVVAHLQGLRGANVEVVLEISAEIPEGVAEEIRRTVTENANTLKFKTHGFERE